MKFEAYKPKIFWEMVFISISILLGAAIVLIPSIRGIPKLISNYGIGFGLLLSSAWIVFCILWGSLLVFLVFAVKLLAKTAHLSVNMENNGITINHNNREWQIPYTDVKYVLESHRGAMLVWDTGKGLKTFFLRRLYFTRKSYNEIIGFLSNLSGYQKDSKENVKTRKQLGLNHIFRKNKLECQL